MSEHNNAIRMAMNLLRQQADSFGTVEVGYHQEAPDPRARHYRAAASTIAALILPEEKVIAASEVRGRFHYPEEDLLDAAADERLDSSPARREKR